MAFLLPLGVGFFAFGILWAELSRLAPASLRSFTAYLAAVVGRNLPIPEAIRAYADDRPGGSALERAALECVAWRIEEGSTLSDALAAYPARFPEWYRALVRAGERGGNLPAVLGGALEVHDFEESSIHRALGYAVYPLFLSFAAVVVYEIGGRVLGPVLGEAAASRAPDSRFLPLGAPAFVLGILALASAALFSWLRHHLVVASAALARGVSRVRWRLPFLSRWERHRALSQFALASSRLIAAGVPAVEALRLSTGAAANARFAELLLDAAGRVEEGTALSVALERADPRGEIPSLLAWFVRHGEATGDLGSALGAAAASAASRRRIAFEAFVRLVLPVGILFAALLVASIGLVMIESMRVLMDPFFRP